MGSCNDFPFTRITTLCRRRVQVISYIFFRSNATMLTGRRRSTLTLLSCVQKPHCIKENHFMSSCSSPQLPGRLYEPWHVFQPNVAMRTGRCRSTLALQSCFQKYHSVWMNHLQSSPSSPFQAYLTGRLYETWHVFRPNAAMRTGRRISTLALPSGVHKNLNIGDIDTLRITYTQ